MKKNVAGQYVYAKMVSRTDGTNLTTGVTVNVITTTASTAGGGTGPTHIANGSWFYIPTAAETNYDCVAFDFIDASGVSVLKQYEPSFPQTGDVFAANPAIRFGIREEAAVAVAVGTNTLQTTGTATPRIGDYVYAWPNASGRTQGQLRRVAGVATATVTGDSDWSPALSLPVSYDLLYGAPAPAIPPAVQLDPTTALKSGIQKNVALANFQFQMTDSVNHAPATGKTVSVTRAIDSGTFAAGSLSAVAEVGFGVYRVNFAAADLNGDVVTLRATASGCDDTLVTIVTDP